MILNGMLRRLILELVSRPSTETSKGGTHTELRLCASIQEGSATQQFPFVSQCRWKFRQISSSGRFANLVQKVNGELGVICLAQLFKMQRAVFEAESMAMLCSNTKENVCRQSNINTITSQSLHSDLKWLFAC